MRLGRCAVYTSQADAAKISDWFADLEKPVTITASQLADNIHLVRYGRRGHSEFSSCSCNHEAMGLLGFKAFSR